MATAELNTISTEELFSKQAPKVAEPTITQPEVQTVSTAELFGQQDTASIPVSTTLNPQSDEQISTQREIPITTKMASEIGKFFFASDTTRQRYQTSYEISQEFDIPLDKVYDDQLYRNLVSDTFSAPKPRDRVFSEVASVTFMTAAAYGLVTAPIPTAKALAYFGVANEVVSLAISGEEYDFKDTKTLVDLVPKNSAPWMYAVAEASDYILKGAMVGGGFKLEGKLRGKVKKGVDDIFTRYKMEQLSEAPQKVAPKELPLGTQEVGLPKDTSKIPVSTKLQPQAEIAKPPIPIKQTLPAVPKDGLPSKAITPQAQQQLIGTPLEGAKSSLEVRAKIASDLGVAPQDLIGGGVGWTARFQPDGHVVDSHPILEWGVKRFHERKVQADENHLRQIKLINEVAKKARKGGRKRLTMKEDPTGVSTWQQDVKAGKGGALWDKLVPTDPLVMEFLESKNPREVAKRMTGEEIEYAYVLHQGWERMFDLAYEAEKINSKLDGYVTHIRRNFIEAWKESGDFGLAFKEARDNFLHDIARLKTRDPKTGKRLPFEKSFRYAMERTGKAIPTANMAKAYLEYNKTFEDMMAYNDVMPAIVEGIKSIKPQDPTPMEKRAYEMLEKFIDQWGKNKKGIPAEWAIDPQSEFAFWLKATRTFVSVMDLGANPIIGASAAVGEASMNYMALGPKAAKLGIERGLTSQGKEIIKKHESWIGRSVWSELADASHQVTDGAMKTLFAFFRMSATELNKHGLLSLITEAEFKSGNISNARLAEIKLQLNRYRYQPGMESIAENTVEGKWVGQYRFSWALPPISSAIKNLTAIKDRIASGKKMTDQQKWEMRRAAEMMLVSLLIAKSFFPDKNDNSVSAKARRKIVREQFTILGAAQVVMNPWSDRVSGLPASLASGMWDVLTGTIRDTPETVARGIKKLKSVAVPGAVRIGMGMFEKDKIKPPSKKSGTDVTKKEPDFIDILETTAPKQRY